MFEPVECITWERFERYSVDFSSEQTHTKRPRISDTHLPCAALPPVAPCLLRRVPFCSSSSHWSFASVSHLSLNDCFCRLTHTHTSYRFCSSNLLYLSLLSAASVWIGVCHFDSSSLRKSLQQLWQQCSTAIWLAVEITICTRAQPGVDCDATVLSR